MEHALQAHPQGISRSACMLAPTFTRNQEHTNAVASQHCEGVKEQHQSVNTRLGAQVAFVDGYPCKKLLNREASKGSNDIPQLGTSAVLAIEQEPQHFVIQSK